ncbi:MAG: nucleotidyltransferase domain-containing protein [Candidatus Schekmanbacteria bacterium]|nr:nucleotidyltransferase domain-containing protein [Candidatus Schekmanbacteria bacterium]
MAEDRDKIINIAVQFVEAVKKTGLNIFNAYLYGSWVKGKAKPDSDIDIAVVSDNFTDDRIKDFVLLAKLGDKIDWRIEAIPFRPENFRDENPLVWEIKKTGIKIA